MDREEFIELKEQMDALKNVNTVLKKEYTKRREKIKKEINKPFEIVYRGMSFANETEIQDAYGSGIITSSARDHLIHRFEEHYKFSSLNITHEETIILKNIIEMVSDKIYEIHEKLFESNRNG